MSYLHVPRIYFGGLFFTNPGTINNIQHNYNPSVTLQKDHQYKSVVAGWAPMGTAQFYLQNCTVLGAVGPDGLPAAGDGSDPLIGASVSTPSPATPEAPDHVSYSIGKLVDLDPKMQTRSEVYGIYVWVQIPGSDAGFWGLMSVPQLRSLNQRTTIGGGSWTLVGTMAGDVSSVQWLGDTSSSQLLSEFRAACAEGISYRLSIDLHQNDQANQFTSGNQLYYGRVHGCFGPAHPARELAQVVPGRMLQVPTSSSSSSSDAQAAAPAPTEQTREAFLDLFSALSAKRATETITLSASPALVNTLADGSSTLAVDLAGASLLLVEGGDQVLGKYAVDRGIELGYMGAGGFVPFAAKPVSFANQYDDRLIGNSQKSCYLVRNNGIADVPLTADELTAIASAPLAVRVDGQLPLQEYASGYWIDLSQASRRLQANEGDTIKLMMRQFGAPVTGPTPELGISVVDSENQASSAVTLTVGPELDANGLVDVAVNGTTPLPLEGTRQYLDSNVYFATITGPDDNPIGDEPTGMPALSVLLWAPYAVKTAPTWDEDVGPILSSYARLYPGMKGILDIADEATVLGSAKALRARMSAPVLDAGYMPVTRDLTPNKVTTIVNWLNLQIDAGNT